MLVYTNEYTFKRVPFFIHFAKTILAVFLLKMILTSKRVKLQSRASSQIVAVLQSFSMVIKVLSFDGDKAVWH